MKMYDNKLVEILQNESYMGSAYGTQVEIKPIPDDDTQGVIDARVLARIMELMSRQQESALPNEDSIRNMRDSTGAPNLYLNTVEMLTRYIKVHVEDRKIPVWIYYPRRPIGQKKRPACIFLHGGSWIAGSPFVVENPMRLLAEKAGCVVFNVDYSLAPEHRFPAALDDAYGVLRHIFENPDEYGIDPKKIGIGGDSAGGNVAAATVLKDRDLGTHMIGRQILIYPVVTAVNTGIRGFEWSLDEYEMSEEQRPMLEPGLILGRPMKKGEEVIQNSLIKYVNTEDEFSDPYVSPMLAESFQGICKTMIMVAEFDGLRLQGEYFGKLLRDNGVETRIIRYKGMGHAFLDHLGYYPQTEDVILEMAKEIASI